MENGIFIGRSAERNLPDTLLNPITEKEMLTSLVMTLSFRGFHDKSKVEIN